MAVLQQFKNSASATLAADLTIGALSLIVASGTGANFPALTAGQFFYVTLFSYSSSRREIVKVTARATDTFTIVRAQDGTAASAFSMGDNVELRVIAADMAQIKTDIDTNTTNITANTSAIALKANIASPTFTGTPTAPTATANNNSAQLATTAYVDLANTLKANLASPTFTGIVTTAGQIAFPATQNPSSDPNTLDDYEEGTWTPVITAQTGTLTTVSSTGVYTKIGRVVHISIIITITNVGTASGIINSTLPFAAVSISQGIGREGNVTGFLLAGIIAGTTVGIINYNNSFAGGNGYSLQVSGTYFV